MGRAGTAICRTTSAISINQVTTHKPKISIDQHLIYVHVDDVSMDDVLIDDMSIDDMMMMLIGIRVSDIYCCCGGSRDRSTSHYHTYHIQY